MIRKVIAEKTKSYLSYNQNTKLNYIHQCLLVSFCSEDFVSDVCDDKNRWKIEWHVLFRMVLVTVLDRKVNNILFCLTSCVLISECFYNTILSWLCYDLHFQKWKKQYPSGTPETEGIVLSLYFVIYKDVRKYYTITLHTCLDLFQKVVDRNKNLEHSSTKTWTLPIDTFWCYSKFLVSR